MHTSFPGDELRSPPQPFSGEQGRKAQPGKGASETQPGQPNHRARTCAACSSLAPWAAPTGPRRPGKGHRRTVDRPGSVIYPRGTCGARLLPAGGLGRPGVGALAACGASLVPPTPAPPGLKPWARTLGVLAELGRFVWAQACARSPPARKETKSLDPHAPAYASPPRASSSPSYRPLCLPGKHRQVSRGCPRPCPKSFFSVN